MQDRIYCSRCQRDLPAEGFAPSQRKPGAYCRTCMSAYNRQYRRVGQPPPRVAPEFKRNQPRPCKDCSTVYEPWCEWDHPGAAGRRCHSCYLAYKQGLQPTPKPRPTVPLIPGVRPGEGNREWRRIKAEVFATETHCHICDEWVDESLHHYDPMSRTVDHVNPVAYGGTHDRSNLRLAHRKCNTDAGRALPPVREVLLRAGLWMGERLGDITAGHGAETAKKISVTHTQDVGSSRVDLQACKLEYSIVSPK